MARRAVDQERADTVSAPKLWRGQTLDDRSADRREQLLAVGTQLLGTAGAAAVTMRAVTRQAALSPRYFYESFETREDLLRAVYDRVETGLLARVEDVVPSGDLRADVREVVDRCARYFEEDPRRARILLREPLGDDTLHEHSAARAPAFIRALVGLLGAEADALLPADEEALAVQATALGGALIALYLDWADGRLALARDRLAAAAVDIVFALTSVGRARG
ncbi:TetR/AcrR family transcriptional regulator [Nocardia farcinica]|uniref:Putative transcriptional regulator n=1 Tax=Nocardia farcinica (strain IFM 10152) TaxID=247156 RepID=Q5Z0K9_NOCFA|nr:TetR/AcrR family transcriptional regulator [Nocardia farcinica]BAD56032.1 putative transcriptional regulator [Nocardia farcinica IFM 10152]